LIHDFDVEAGRDRLFGGGGDDVLTGDQEVFVAGVVVNGASGANMSVYIEALIDKLTLDADRDALDGGTGRDSLHGDQVFVLTGVVDACGDASLPAGMGVLSVDIDALVDRVELKADQDTLRGGEGEDYLLGDSQIVVSAFHGAASGQASASVVLTGRALAGSIDVRGDKDVLRGGDGDDRLVGDNDVSVSLQAGASAMPEAVFGMTRLVDYLKVDAGRDDMQGEAGNDAITPGNRVQADAALVEKTRVASNSSGSLPVSPLIDWAGGSAANAGGPAAGAGTRHWIGDFVNHLARTQAQRSPNASMQVRVGDPDAFT